MVRSELIQKLFDEHTDLTLKAAEAAVGAIFTEITSALEQGNRVELRGFGSFQSRMRKARVGRNPRTGEAVSVEEKRAPFFKPGKLITDRLNRKL